MSWNVFVDWANNDSFLDSIDDITSDVISLEWQLGIRQPYADVSEGGQCKIVVKNDDGKYTPENVTSPIYGYMLPQRRIKIVYDNGVTIKTMFIGWVEFPSIAWKRAGSSAGAITAEITGQDSKRLLDNLEVGLQQYTNITADTIIDKVLQLGQIPPAVAGVWILGEPGKSELGNTSYLGAKSDYSTIGTGVTVFPTYGDQQPRTGWDIIKEVTTAERGRFFFDREGKAVFWNRHQLLTSIAIAGTVSTTSGYKPVSMNYSYAENLANSIKVTAQPRQTGATEKLWELESGISIPPNSFKEWEIRLRKSNGQFAGSGSLAGSASFSAGTAVMTVTPEGGKATVKADNSNNNIAAELDAYSVTGSPTVQQNALTVERLDSSSIADYGKRAWALSLNAVEGYTDIASIAEFELHRRATPIGSVNEVRFKSKSDGTANIHQLEWTIGDRLRLQATELGHDAEYFVIGEQHKLSRGHIHDSRLFIEPAELGTYWQLGEAGYSELGDTTYIAY